MSGAGLPQISLLLAEIFGILVFNSVNLDWHLTLLSCADLRGLVTESGYESGHLCTISKAKSSSSVILSTRNVLIFIGYGSSSFRAASPRSSGEQSS